MTTRIHSMPYGAELQPDGKVRFRLWAPTAKQVTLFLPDQKQEVPIPALADGWYELTTALAKIDSLYQYRIDGHLLVPDPASRSNPQDVHGPSRVVDPTAFKWTDAAWEGRPWHQAVCYELHVGTFSTSGTYAGVEQHLDHLVKLGVTALQIMPLAEFPGERNWGYDGVLPFAPDAAYGTPEELKHLVCAAHQRGLMVMLDVVYNHFGPDGNYLHTYAKTFFTNKHKTPWGEAINFDDKMSRPVREFFINNALYWLEEFHLDGLRFDAVHAVRDDSPLDIFTEISHRVRERFSRERPIHLVLENVNNEAFRLDKPQAAPGRFEGQWNDDIHHCLHAVITNEGDGYYEDFHPERYRLLARSLAEGFAYQGELSRFRHNRPRGEPSSRLPPTCFVSFLQNHDQIGNRARGERLTEITDPRALKAAAAVMLLSPQIPMLFMGEEWGALEPFPFFCDFNPELAEAVRKGRLEEFSRFEKFKSPEAQAQIPDPNAVSTTDMARLDWTQLSDSKHTEWLAHYSALLDIRHKHIVPLLPHMRSGSYEVHDTQVFTVHWPVTDGHTLTLIANLTSEAHPLPETPAGQRLFSTAQDASQTLPPWSVVCAVARSSVR